MPCFEIRKFCFQHNKMEACPDIKYIIFCLLQFKSLLLFQKSFALKFASNVSMASPRLLCFHYKIIVSIVVKLVLVANNVSTRCISLESRKQPMYEAWNSMHVRKHQAWALPVRHCWSNLHLSLLCSSVRPGGRAGQPRRWSKTRSKVTWWGGVAHQRWWTGGPSGRNADDERKQGIVVSGV